jgi:hypothetical protein
MVLLSELAQLYAADSAVRPQSPPSLVFPTDQIPVLSKLSAKLYSAPVPGVIQLIKKVLIWIAQAPLFFLRPAGQGYLEVPGAPFGKLELRTEQVFASFLSAMAFVAYMAIGVGKNFITKDQATFPALAFVFLFFNVGCWALGALTFFFDRYRVPTLAPLLVLSLVTGSTYLAPESDHFFRVETLKTRAPYLTPGEYLNGRIERNNKSGKKNLIFVATPGGGIQAAAWTAEVLAELGRHNPDFRTAVCFISSVSGGSLGSLVYAASFDGSATNPADIEKNAMASAIDEVAWGWTQPDFWRAVVPWFRHRTVDRGWALEEKWISVNGLGTVREGPRVGTLHAIQRIWNGTHDDPRDTLLSDWAAKGVEMPALVFNSMLVESGKHVVFSTTNYPRENDPRGLVNFYQLYPDRKVDVRVATAARLSASFPYVAPASRPDIEPCCQPAYHFVDGGYFDNDGVDSLIGWLLEAMQEDGLGQDQLGDILILQLRHFNSGLKPIDPKGVPIEFGSKPPASQQGWPFQLVAPLDGLLSMWNSSAGSRDRNELEMFKNAYDDDGHHIWLATAQFKGDDQTCAPLSWKLSRQQQNCVTDSWKGIENDANSALLKCVNAYLSRDPSKAIPAACQVLP